MKVLACVAAAMAAFLSYAPAISPAHAETTLCTEITALPFTIAVQGVYCLKQNLNVNVSAFNSAAITINAGNVTIDFNGFRVNNQAPLATNLAYGVFAQNRKNITLRNGFIRGFNYGVSLSETVADASDSHLVETMKIADSGQIGIWLMGNRSVLRNNRILETGGGPNSDAYGMLIQIADDAVIAENIVFGVSETVLNYGINFNFSNRIRVVGNEIANIDGGSSDDRAIGLATINHAVISDNRLLNNPASGTGGIVDTNSASINIACLENEIGGFGSAQLSGCDVNQRNEALYN